jgi:HEPN domain-containing protein
LFEIVGPKVPLDADVVLIEKMDKLYIDARYPGELGLLPDGKPTHVDAQEFYACAQSIYEQTKQALNPGQYTASLAGESGNLRTVYSITNRNK